MTRPPIPAAALALLLLGSAAPAQSSCSYAWAPGFENEGYFDRATVVEFFDLGGGPELYAAGALYRGGIHSANVARFDGQSWIPLGSGFLSQNPAANSGVVYALAAYDDGTGPSLYAAGGFVSADGHAISNIAKWNGTTWVPVGAGTNDFVEALAVHDDGVRPVLYAAGWFTMAGGATVRKIAYWDGLAWHGLPLTFPSAGLLALTELAVFDDGSGPTLAVGSYMNVAPTAAVTRWRSATWSWSSLGAGFNGAASALAPGLPGTAASLHAAESFISPATIVSWNGSVWTPAGAGLFPSAAWPARVASLRAVPDPTGARLWAAGRFSVSPGGPPSFFASFDGAAWTAEPGSSNPALTGAFMYGAGPGTWLAWGGAGPAGPSLHAGGDLFRFGDFATTAVARRTASGWKRVGGGNGFDAKVTALAAGDIGSGPQVFAGGDFRRAGDVDVRSVARGDGTVWAPLGEGLAARPLVLLVADLGSGPRLFAGGAATSWAPAFVGAFDGRSWQPLGSGTDGAVAAMAALPPALGGGLAAGGSFSMAGGLPAAAVARWNGIGWSPLGAGLDGAVRALEVFDDGGGPALFAGGDFTGRVARFDGAAWTPAAAGFGGLIDSFAVADLGAGPRLYASGHDPAASPYSSGRVWRLDGASFTTVAVATFSTPSSPVRVTSIRPFQEPGRTVLCAAGSFRFVDGTPARSVARFDGASWSAVASQLGFFGYQDAHPIVIAAADLGSGDSLFLGGAFVDVDGRGSQFIARRRAARPAILLRPLVPGSPLTIVRNEALVPGHEYFNLFNLEPCASSTATAQALGLCFTPAGLGLLLAELQQPVGSWPFHFIAWDGAATFGPYSLPPGLAVDGVCADVTGGVLGCWSPPFRYVAP